MICDRCGNRIHSGKIMKHTIESTMETYYYCKHCFNALKLKVNNG